MQQPEWLSGRATLGFHLLEGFFYLVVIFDHRDSPVKSVLLSFHKWGNWGLVQGHAGRKSWSWACLTSKHLSVLLLLMITQTIIYSWLWTYSAPMGTWDHLLGGAVPSLDPSQRWSYRSCQVGLRFMPRLKSSEIPFWENPRPLMPWSPWVTSCLS